VKLRNVAGTIRGVAEFLSAQWIGELAAAAAGIRDGASLGVDLVIDQEVHGAPGGDVRYRVRCSADGLTVTDETGPETADADLVLVTDYSTARALHEGNTRAQDALAAGALKIRGSPERLAAAAAVLETMAAAFAPVRNRTTFRGGSGEG
jgi:hypothetical protein